MSRRWRARWTAGDRRYVVELPGHPWPWGTYHRLWVARWVAWRLNRTRLYR